MLSIRCFHLIPFWFNKGIRIGWFRKLCISCVVALWSTASWWTTYDLCLLDEHLASIRLPARLQPFLKPDQTPDRCLDSVRYPFHLELVCTFDAIYYIAYHEILQRHIPKPCLPPDRIRITGYILRDSHSLSFELVPCSVANPQRQETSCSLYVHYGSPHFYCRLCYLEYR